MVGLLVKLFDDLHQQYQHITDSAAQPQNQAA
jgi:hypothetical protein